MAQRLTTCKIVFLTENIISNYFNNSMKHNNENILCIEVHYTIQIPQASSLLVKNTQCFSKQHYSHEDVLNWSKIIVILS